MKTNPGSLLRWARLQAGLSQAEVELALGIWQPSLSLFERGLRPVPKNLRLKLAELYHEDVNLLFPESE